MQPEIKVPVYLYDVSGMTDERVQRLFRLEAGLVEIPGVREKHITLLPPPRIEMMTLEAEK